MHLANGEHGYGLVSKLLHWLTVLAIVAQFAIGLTMDADAAADRAEDALDARSEALEERAEQRGEAAEERVEAEVERREEAAEALESQVPRTHLLVGLLVLGLGVVRLGWRRVGGLPPWAEHLSQGERSLEGWLEKAMLTLLLAVPLTGLLLVLVDDDLLPLHVAAQVALVLVVAAHVGLVLRHTVVRRHRHLSRML